MDLATFIEQTRDKKKLSFRDLERSGELDHAYIWHLAKGTKTAPSVETLEKLSAALQLDERERDVLALLAKQTLDDGLFNVMLKRRDIDWDDFAGVPQVSNRGQRPMTEESWVSLIELMREHFK